MVNQGLFGAIWQYWDIQEKPRLDRRNTYFDESVSNAVALRFGVAFILLALAIMVSWCVTGVII